MSILFSKGLLSIGQLTNRYLAARSRYRTEIAIRALPIELQKDIGWPESDDLRVQAQASKAPCLTVESENSLCFQ